MANIKVVSELPLFDGMTVTFRAPCECSAVEGLTVSYLGADQSFTFRDTHGNDLTNIGNLFSEGALVKVVLDIVNGGAYIQNADTNAYLERRFIAEGEDADYPGCFYRMVGEEREWINPPMVLETEYRTTERYQGKPVYTKLFDFGILPGYNNKTWKDYELTVTNFIRVEGKSDFTYFPRIGTFGATVGNDVSLAGIGVYVAHKFDAPGWVSICVYSDMYSSDRTATIQLWYTKD